MSLEASLFGDFQNQCIEQIKKTKFFVRTEKILYSKFPMFYTVFHFLTLLCKYMQYNWNQIMALPTVGAVFGVFRIFCQKKL